MASALWLALLAADFAGIWVGRIPRQNGEPLDVALRFTQQGTVLSGKLYDDFKSPPVVEGKVTGDTVSFVVVVAEQAGNQINETRYRYSGVLKDGELELTRERQSSRNAGNGGEVQMKNNAKQTFRVKRLY
jgi:hypothetical protein